MKTKKRSVQKEIKQPDEFVTFWTRVIEYVVEHKRQFLMGAAGVLVLILLISAGVAYFQKREERASAMFAQIQARLVPARTAGPGPVMETQQELDDEDRREVVSQLEALVDGYGGTKGGQRGRLLLAQMFYEQGDADASLKMYQAFLDGRGTPAEMQAVAWEGMAYAREAKGNYAGAIPCYEELLKMDLSYLKPWALMGIARCYQQEGQPEKALDAYRRMLADYPRHPEVNKAKASIAKISQQGRTSKDGSGDATAGSGASTSPGEPGP